MLIHHVRRNKGIFCYFLDVKEIACFTGELILIKSKQVNNSLDIIEDKQEYLENKLREKQH